MSLQVEDTYLVVLLPVVSTWTLGPGFCPAVKRTKTNLLVLFFFDGEDAKTGQCKESTQHVDTQTTIHVYRASPITSEVVGVAP